LSQILPRRPPIHPVLPYIKSEVDGYKRVCSTLERVLEVKRSGHDTIPRRTIYAKVLTTKLHEQIRLKFYLAAVKVIEAVLSVTEVYFKHMVSFGNVTV
jgi:hypothetical protein